MSYAGKPYQPPGPIASPQQATNSLGVVALVLGILSVFMGCPFAIGALITGWMGMRQEPSGMARAGFTIGLIMTIFNVVAGIVGLMFLVLFVGIAGLGAYVDSQDSGSESYTSYPTPSVPTPSYPSPSFPSPSYPTPPLPGDGEFGSPYGSSEMEPFPVSMPQPMGPSYVPPAMPPGVGPGSFPGPANFGPPGSMPPGAFPPGAFPPGLGLPTTMETLSPASDSADDDLDP